MQAESKPEDSNIPAIATTEESVAEPVLLYAIHCLDDQSVGMVDKGVRFGGSVLRIGNYTVHREWQTVTSDPASPHYIKKICAGPMESDDGKYMIGSLFIVQSTRSQAEAFIQQDPFFINHVWEKISITRYVSIPNGIKPVRMEMDGDDRTTIRMITDW